VPASVALLVHLGVRVNQYVQSWHHKRFFVGTHFGPSDFAESGHGEWTIDKMHGV